MKKLTELMMVFVMLTSLSSCTGQQDLSDDLQNDVELTFESVKNVKNQISSTSTEYENMDISENALNELQENFPDNADSVILSQVCDYDKNFEILRPLFISDDEYNSEYYQGFQKQLPSGNEYNDGDRYLLAATNGGFSYAQDESAYNGEEVESFYKLDDLDDKAYTLSGTEYKVSDAVNYINEQLKNYADIGYGNMKIACVKVLKFGKEYAYEFDIQRYENGMALNRFFYLDGTEAYCPYFAVKIFMTKPEHISELLGNTGFVKISQVNEKNDKIITLSNALEICEQTLAENHKYEVDEIDFGYMPELENKDKNFFYDDNSKYSAEPGWFIWLDDTLDYERMAFVNALTGEVKLYFNNAEENE